MEDGLPWLNGSGPERTGFGDCPDIWCTGIPFTLLLDENNRIVAKNLRGKNWQKR